jgi:hypothetical protein
VSLKKIIGAMERLFLKGTEETPEIVFDKDKPEFRVAGKSYMEDATSHYSKVIAWLLEYSKNPNDSTVFRFELEYVNTASSKIVHDILDVLDNMHLDGVSVTVVWCYYEDDEDMEELGREYEEIYEVPFRYEKLNYDGPHHMFEID